MNETQQTLDDIEEAARQICGTGCGEPERYCRCDAMFDAYRDERCGYND